MAKQESLERAPISATSRRRGWEATGALVTLLFLAFMPAIAKSQAGGDTSTDSPLNQIVWSLLYVIAALRIVAIRKNVAAIATRSTALWSFGLFMLLSTVWSVAPLVSLKQSIEMLGTLVIALYIVLYFPLDQFLSILSRVFGAVSVVCLIAVFVAPGRARTFFGSGAWSGIYPEKNLLGASMALAIISLAIWFMASRRRERLLAGVGAIVAIVVLVGSNSVTSGIDCGVTVLLSAVTVGGRSKRFGWPIRILATIGIFGTIIAVAVGINASSILSMLGRSADLTGRTDFWPYLQVAIADRPVLGYGYDAFFTAPIALDYLGQYLVASGGWTPYHAHNSFLQILLNSGAAGMAIFTIVLLKGLFRGVRYIAEDSDPVRVWPTAVLVYLILGSFSESYLGGFNSFESLLFAAAYYYPERNTFIVITEVRAATVPKAGRGNFESC